MIKVAEAAAVGGLSLVKKCGDSTCENDFYCSSHATICMPCEPVCQVGDNNFDQSICEGLCQDYIHDHIKNYSIGDFHKAMKNLQETIDSLRNLTAFSLSLSVVLFIIMAVVGGFLWLRHRRLVKKEQDLMDKKMSTVNTIVNNNVSNDLPHKLPSSASNTAAPSVITEFTQVSRRPEEDSTLEYHAYDNEGMVPSPVSVGHDPKDETMF